jgi:hypothetical protein
VSVAPCHAASAFVHLARVASRKEYGRPVAPASSRIAAQVPAANNDRSSSTHRVENAAREDGGGIVSLGAFARRTDDTSTLLRDRTLDEHREDRIASDAVTFCDEQYITARQSV